MMMPALVVLAIGACARSISSPGAEEADPNLKQLFEVLLADRVNVVDGFPAGDYVVVVTDSIAFCQSKDDCLTTRSDLEGIETFAAEPNGLRERLISENQSSKPLAISDRRARLISAPELRRIFSGKGWWEEFYRLYPKSRGYLEFGKPVFSNDGNHALVYLSHVCGGLCGSAWLYHLEKRNQRWQIAGAKMVWIS